jgi:hypothetical protein
MKTPIQSKIQEELHEFDRDITVTSNWTFNQKATIEQGILYFNSKFIDGDEVDGFKQFFSPNVIRPACGTTTKAIDIDTKDILLMTAPGGNSLKTWFYQRDLKNWMETKEFGVVLNRISEELPIYGSVVLKKINNDVKFVSLKNFVCEQNADTLDQSNYIIEQHYYTPMEFKRIGKEKKWKNIDETISKYQGSKEQYIRVFERYGMVEEDNGEFNYKMVLVADIPVDIKNNKQQEIEINSDIILAEKKVDKHPYFEIHIFKVPGRWLGVGVPELLSDTQIRLCEITNQEAKSSYWSSLRIWQSRDNGIKRNLLKAVKDGDVLSVDEEINPVAMEDRNTYASYQAQREQLKSNAQEMTFSFDVISGKRTPAGTPLGSAQLSASMSMSYFDQIKENVALAIKRLFYTYVIPECFAKEATKAHIVRIMGEDVEKMMDMMVETRSRKKWFDFIVKTGRVPSPEMMEMVKEVDRKQLQGRGELMIGIEEDWFKDVAYDVRIVITDESMDAATEAQNLVGALQTITTDPTILQDPTKKKIFSKYLEKGGINLAEIEASIPKGQPMELIETPGAGGGVSSATPAQPGVKTRTRTL